MGLFKKAAICGDIHFGEHLDSEQHNEDCIEFIQWFVEQTRSQNADAVFFLGDWHHNRIRTENRTGFYSRVGVELLNSLRLPVFWILGNHELYFRNSRAVHSLQHLTRYRNIHLIDRPQLVDDVLLVPWLVGEEHQTIPEYKCKYVFGHFELPFFLMNQVIEKVYDGSGLHIDDFKNCDAVYSGHFHKRQCRLNKAGIPVYYIGNCFGHNFNDVNDTERGMALLEWGETVPTFMSWPDAPTFHRYTVSEFLQRLENGEQNLFGPRSSIELIDDMTLSSEIVAQLKEVITCRKVHFRKPKQQTNAEAVSATPHFGSFDELVESKLRSMSYDGKFDVSLLVDIYKNV